MRQYDVGLVDGFVSDSSILQSSIENGSAGFTLGCLLLERKYFSNRNFVTENIQTWLGLKTILESKSILDWSKELFEISKKGLENRNELNSKNQNEVKFLDHIKTIIDSNNTNAEVIMAKYLKDKNFWKMMQQMAAQNYASNVNFDSEEHQYEVPVRKIFEVNHVQEF